MFNAFKFCVPASLFIVLIILSAGCFAAETQQDRQIAFVLDDIVVTATRDTQEIRKTPANVTVIKAEELRSLGVTTVVEALDRLESIQFRTYSGNASQALIDIRGFGGDNPYGKALILLDGRRLNRPDMASINWLQIPVQSIERIEIVRGPGSVLYGDAAIGGVINIITQKGKDKPTFNASALTGSYGLHNERIGVVGSTDKWTYALNGENQASSGYRDRSEYSAQSGGFDFGYTAHDLLELSLGASFNKVDYQMPGALTKEQMAQNRRQYQPAMPLYWMNAHPDDDGSDEYTSFNLEIKSASQSYGQFALKVMYGRKSLQMNMPSWNSYNYSDTKTDTYGVAPKYILEKDILGFHNKVIAGIDYCKEPYKKDIFSDRERTTKLSTANFTRESVGYYIRDEFSLLKELIFSAGCRFEQSTIRGNNSDLSLPFNNFDNENRYHAEAYEAGLTWLFGKKSRAFAKYATVYRIPFLDEVASFSGFGAQFLTDLKMEKGSSMEAGAEFYPLENLKVGLTVFRVDMADEIEYVYDPITFTGSNRNTGMTRHDGAELSVSYSHQNYFKIYGNMVYHEATFENGSCNKKVMPLVPSRIVNSGIEIYLPFDLTLKPEMRYVGNTFLSGDSDNNTEKLDSFTLFDFYLIYKPKVNKLNISAFAGVENVADKMYSSFGIDYEQYSMPNFYYPMPGRTFKAGISLEF